MGFTYRRFCMSGLPYRTCRKMLLGSMTYSRGKNSPPRNSQITGKPRQNHCILPFYKAHRILKQASKKQAFALEAAYPAGVYESKAPASKQAGKQADEQTNQKANKQTRRRQARAQSGYSRASRQGQQAAKQASERASKQVRRTSQQSGAGPKPQRQQASSCRFSNKSAANQISCSNGRQAAADKQQRRHAGADQQQTAEKQQQTSRKHAASKQQTSSSRPAASANRQHLQLKPKSLEA